MSKTDRDMPTSTSTWVYGVIILMVIVFFVAPPLYRWWNLPPAVQIANLDCIQLLRTAISSKNTQHVEGVKKLLDKRVADEKMSTQERDHFDSILKLAQSNRWEEADSECIRFEQAQLNRRR
jgi:hypothetical protein